MDEMAATNKHGLCIDYGTGFCVVTVCNKDGSRTVPDPETGQNEVPSDVYANRAGDISLSPKEGFHRISFIKLLIGRTVDELDKLRTVAKTCNVRLHRPARAEDGAYLMISVDEDGAKPFLSVACALVLFHLLLARCKEAYQGESFEWADLTVPARMPMPARSLLQRAFGAAVAQHFPDARVSLMLEPVAAIMNQPSLQHLCKEGKLVITVDMGVGTTDICVVYQHPVTRIYHVLWYGGDEALGGRNADYLIARYLAKAAVNVDNHFDTLGPAGREELMSKARLVKEGARSVTVCVQDGLTRVTATIRVNLEQLNEILQPFLNQYKGVLERALEDASADERVKDVLQRSGVSTDLRTATVVLAGGSSRMKGVQKVTESVCKHVTLAPNGQTAIALGAAVAQHAKHFGDATDRKVVCTAPYTVCLDVTTGGVPDLLPLIKQGQDLPTPATVPPHLSVPKECPELAVDLYVFDRQDGGPFTKAAPTDPGAVLISKRSIRCPDGGLFKPGAKVEYRAYMDDNADVVFQVEVEGVKSGGTVQVEINHGDVDDVLTKILAALKARDDLLALLPDHAEAFDSIRDKRSRLTPEQERALWGFIATKLAEHAAEAKTMSLEQLVQTPIMSNWHRVGEHLLDLAAKELFPRLRGGGQGTADEKGTASSDSEDGDDSDDSDDSDGADGDGTPQPVAGAKGQGVEDDHEQAAGPQAEGTEGAGGPSVGNEGADRQGKVGPGDLAEGAEPPAKKLKV